jgi:hypothetical protein
MLHDPDAFAHVTRQMRNAARPAAPVETPSLPELIRRLEEAARCAARRPAP